MAVDLRLKLFFELINKGDIIVKPILIPSLSQQTPLIKPQTEEKFLPQIVVS